MFRALFYILLVAGLALVFAWFAENPGQLTIDWPGYQIDVTLFGFTVAILIVGGLTFLLFSFIGRVLVGPKRLRRFMKKRRREKGLTALRRGIFAVGAGDEATAARYSVEARRALRNEPLTMLLDAQAAQLSGDHRAAQRLFEAMSENPETRLLGLRGLFLEASREKQMVAAEQYAARAIQLNPALQWPVHALFDMQCRTRNWQSALETLSIARTHRHIDRPTHDRRKAVLLTAQAYDLENSEAARALDLALEAHRIEPRLVPAAVIAGRILSSQGNASRAARVLAKTWQYNPHPELAVGYAYARPGDAPRDRLNRIKSLIVLNPDETEARVALASTATDAQDWEEAREALEPLLETGATARVCALMARIEGGQNRDAGRVREWLARAVRAPRDAVWMADGVIFSQWEPISPVSGTLDAFEWRVPPDRSKKADSDALINEFASLSHDVENVALQIGNDWSKDEAEEPLTITIEANQSEVETAPADEAETVVADEGEHLAAASVDEAQKSIEADTIEDKSMELAVVEIEGSGEGDDVKAVTATAPKSTDKDVKSTAPAVPAKREKAPERKGPNIFVPSRPPDDPGPDQIDFDENSTAYSRFRDGLKTQTT
jgi:HemY protein